jgi:hypothetical protein
LIRLLALAILGAAILAGCDLLPAPIRPVLTEAEAVAMARAAAPEMYRDADLLDARQVAYGEVANEHAEPIEGERLGPDDCVWFINLGSNPGPLMGSGVFVTIDCVTRNLVHVTEWMS